ncbi:MAG TPA: hypothetical protein VHO69_02440 [Phototrophicaceae bacterium]|nr:hypothetical protein [Phototrophicaceae bacterium]
MAADEAAAAAALQKRNDLMAAYNQELAETASSQYQPELTVDKAAQARVAKMKQALDAEKKAWVDHWQGMIKDVREFTDGVKGALDVLPERLLAMSQVGEAVRGMQGTLAGAMGVAYAYQPGQMDLGAMGAMQAGGVQDFQMPNLPEFMTADQARIIREQFQQAAMEVDRLKGLADQGLINPEDLSKAEGLKNNLGMMADEADRAAAAFANMKLSDVTGAGGGGMGGEITDMVIQQMQASGKYTPEQIAAMQRSLDLQSGRETNASLFMKEQLVPTLAGMSPEQAAGAQSNLVTAMQQAALMGISPDQLVNLPAMLGMTPNGQVVQGMNPQVLAMMGAGQGMNIIQGGLGAAWNLMGGTTGAGANPMAGFNALAGLFGGGGKEGEAGGGLQAGVTALTDMGTQMGIVDAASATTATNFTNINSELLTADTSLKSLEGALKRIEGVHNVKIVVDVQLTGPGAGLVGTGGGLDLGTAVRNNGGTVPGTSTRTER